MKKLLLSFVIAFCIGVISFQLIPTKNVIEVSGILENLSKEDLVINSDVVISGRVLKILPSKWSHSYLKNTDTRNILTTDVEFEIDEIFKGIPYNKKITVRIEKGSDDKTIVTSDIDPDFTPGEYTLLFLKKDETILFDDTMDYYVICGGTQGKYLPENKDDVTGIYKCVFENKEDISYSCLKAEIQDILEKNEKNPKVTMSPEEVRENNKSLWSD